MNWARYKQTVCVAQHMSSVCGLVHKLILKWLIATWFISRFEHCIHYIHTYIHTHTQTNKQTYSYYVYIDDFWQYLNCIYAFCIIFFVFLNGWHHVNRAMNHSVIHVVTLHYIVSPPAFSSQNISFSAVWARVLLHSLITTCDCY